MRGRIKARLQRRVLMGRLVVVVLVVTSLCSLATLVVIRNCYENELLEPTSRRRPPLGVVHCRVLRGLDDAVDADVSPRDGDGVYDGGDEISRFDELDVIEACQGVRPVLMSTHAVDRRYSNEG